MKTRTFELCVEEGPEWAQWQLNLVGDNLYEAFQYSVVALIDKDGGDCVVLSIEEAIDHSKQLFEALKVELSNFQIFEAEEKNISTSDATS